MGVTGTLDALSDTEKWIIQDYGITRIGYAPSVYGNSMLEFKEREHINVLTDEETYFLTGQLHTRRLPQTRTRVA